MKAEEARLAALAYPEKMFQERLERTLNDIGRYSSKLGKFELEIRSYVADSTINTAERLNQTLISLGYKVEFVKRASNEHPLDLGVSYLISWGEEK